MKARLLYLFLFHFTLIFFGQQFSISGDASQLDAVTYKLTNASNNNKGMMTNYYPLDLTANFSRFFQLNFGTKDDGADGFAFVLTKECNPVLIGGGGLGAEGLTNSIIAEFDTYYNGSPYDQDISSDHIGIYKNGLVSRTSGAIMDMNSHNPVSVGNVEDGQWYSVEIRWTYSTPTSQKIEVYFNNVLKQSYTGNLIGIIGKNKAFWSITAATGDLNNQQLVKVDGENNTFTYNCGSSFQLIAPGEGSNYIWTPTPISSTGNVANYVSYTSQTITCNYKDYCGADKSVNFNIIVNPLTPTFSPIGSFCEGEAPPILPNTSNNGYTGTWSPNVVSNTISKDYTFTPTISCVTPVTIHVTVKPKPLTTTITPN